MTNPCLYCSALKTVEMDAQYGLFQHYSVATLNVFAKRNKLSELPSDKIFEFILELDFRMTGSPALNKELSYYGAIRCTPQ